MVDTLRVGFFPEGPFGLGLGGPKKKKTTDEGARPAKKQGKGGGGGAVRGRRKALKDNSNKEPGKRLTKQNVEKVTTKFPDIARGGREKYWGSMAGEREMNGVGGGAGSTRGRRSEGERSRQRSPGKQEKNSTKRSFNCPNWQMDKEAKKKFRGGGNNSGGK